MMKAKSFGILVVAFILLAAISVTLIVFIEHARERFPEDITVHSEGVTESTLPVRDLRLNPSESKEYSVNLVCLASGSYHVALDFLETVDGGMKKFVNVHVSCDGVEAFSGSLADLFHEGSLVEFETELHETEPVVITVKYEMPRETGNEAQGTYADFDVHLKITKS